MNYSKKYINGSSVNFETQDFFIMVADASNAMQRTKTMLHFPIFIDS